MALLSLSLALLGSLFFNGELRRGSFKAHKGIYQSFSSPFFVRVCECVSTLKNTTPSTADLHFTMATKVHKW